MKILVACEESQAVTIELRRLGHEAYSCDTQECSGGHHEWHIKQNVLPLLDGYCIFRTEDYEWHYLQGRWDMIIAFPPCTHLAVSGARHFEKKRKLGIQQEGIEFFCKFLNAKCDRIAIEKPRWDYQRRLYSQVVPVPGTKARFAQETFSDYSAL